MPPRSPAKLSPEDVLDLTDRGAHSLHHAGMAIGSGTAVANIPLPASGKRQWLVLSSWLAILLISDLPDIIFKTALGRIPATTFWFKLAILGLLFLVCSASKRMRPLRPFAGVMLVFYLVLAASGWLGNLAWWKSRFSGIHTSFTVGYLGIYIRDSAVAVAVIAALYLVKWRRGDFFLVKGQLDAPIAPVSWLGIKAGNSWRVFGWIFLSVASLAVLIPTVLALPLSWDTLVRALPLLPAGILFSAINAFNEEIYYRASLLSTLSEVIGSTQALFLNAVFFGLAHYLYGSPPGLVGFLMTGFLAWLLGKSMLETRGLAWPWLMHFVPDIVVFTSYALAWVQR